MKAKAKSRAVTWQVILGGLIVIAVIVVIGLKAVQGRSTSVAAASPTQAASTLVVSVGDPMPADPAGQLNWVEERNYPAMVIYRSTSCIPCIAMGKLIEQVRADYEPQVAFVTVLTDEPNNSLLVRQAGIQAIPTSFFVRPDAEAVKVLGAMEESALRAQLETLKTGQ